MSSGLDWTPGGGGGGGDINVFCPVVVTVVSVPVELPLSAPVGLENAGLLGGGGGGSSAISIVRILLLLLELMVKLLFYRTLILSLRTSETVLFITNLFSSAPDMFVNIE